MYDNTTVFISYRRDDTKWFALTLVYNIKQYLPKVNLFLDVLSIGLGQDFPTILSQTLDQASVQLVLIGKKWLTAQDKAGRRRIDLEDDWTRLEIARALDRNIRVIPVLVDGAEMPRAEFLPMSLTGLSNRQKLSIEFENNESGIMNILTSLSTVLNMKLEIPAQGTPAPENVTSGPIIQQSAMSVLDFFEEEYTNDKTLTILGEQQLDYGRFGLAKGIFELISTRKMQQSNGTPDIDTCRAKYLVGKAKLLNGEINAAIIDFKIILPYIEMERDESYPLYIRTQVALARAYLENGNINEALQTVPTVRGIFFRDQSLTAFDLWIAYLNKSSSQSQIDLMNELNEELASHSPTIEFARSIARFRETITNKLLKPTMLWHADKV